jgi:hypothetical protein
MASNSDAASSQENAQQTRETQRNQIPDRSCDLCRLRKVRCQQIDGQNGRCRRCQKMDLSCVYAVPAVQQRRKRINLRVAEL